MAKGRSTQPPIKFPAPQPSKPSPIDEILADPALDPLTRLKDIVRQIDRAHDEWTAAEARCDELVEGSDKLAAAQLEVRGAFNRWHALQDMAKRAEEEVRRRSLEIPRTGRWADEYVQVLGDLKGQYEGLGSHYDLLCEHTASLTIRLRMMEHSGRDVSSGEYVEMHKLYLGYVNQLQKYTEAMKTQSINKVTQEVAEQIMQIFERHFGQLNPAEWKEAIHEITVMTQEGTWAA